jgi:diguanylate cyclase (GGDEF)-like protein
LAFRLLVVVLIPVVALAPFAYAEVRRSGDYANDAARAADAVALLRASQSLLLPLYTEATATSGLRSAELNGVDQATISRLTGIDFVPQVLAARSELDAGLANLLAVGGRVRLQTGTTIGEEIAAARAAMSEARQAFDDERLATVDLSRSFGRLVVLVHDIDDITTAVFDRSASNAALVTVVSDTRVFGEALQFVSIQLEAIVESATTGVTGTALYDLLSASGSFRSALDRLETRLSPARRATLTELRARPAWDLADEAERRWVLAVAEASITDTLVIDSPTALAAVADLLTAAFTRLDDLQQYGATFLAEELRIANEIQSSAATRHRTALVLTDGAIALSLVLFAVVIVSVVRPLRSLLRNSHQVREGDLAVEPAPPSGPTDIRLLTQTFNEMVVTLRAFDAQVQRLARGEAVIERPLPGPLGETLRESVSHLAEVTQQLHLSEAAAVIQARTDSLTGLANRASVLEHLSTMGANARERGEPGAIVYLDLDGFKNVNDTQGHGAGDRILRQIGARLRSACPNDLVARMGGDEFIVLVERAGDINKVEAFAAQLIALVGEPCEARDGQQFVLTASAGVTLVDGQCEPLECIARADSAVYSAKEQGRSRVEAYDEQLAAELESRSAMALMMRRGLENDEFQLHFQPVVNLTTDRPVAVEALLRWTLPDGRAVSPAEFIPIAERTGVIVAIDEWVIDHGLAVLREWQHDPITRDLRLAINISGRHLADRSLPRIMADKCAAAEVDPHRIGVEITETYLMADAHRARTILDELRQLGVSVAIDDFGTGYSSMGSLHELNADALKIDQMFVDGITRTAVDRTIVELVLRLADSLGMIVIAEGVDSEDKLVQLKALGCKYAQGYHIVVPMDLDTCTTWLTDRITRLNHGDLFEGSLAPGG